MFFDQGNHLVWGIIKAVLLLRLGMDDQFNVAFSATYWMSKILGTYTTDDEVPFGMPGSTISKWMGIQLQLATFFMTLFVLGPGWPWVIFGFKLVAGLLVALIALHSPLLVIGRAPAKAQEAYRGFLSKFWLNVYSGGLLAFRIVGDVVDYLDAFVWFWLPWGFRLAGEYLENCFYKDRDLYVYADIDSSVGEIRLLRIPRQRFFGGHLRCSIQVARLDQAPRYEALSYRWAFGSVVPKDGSKPKIEYRTIFINDRRLQIPKSAWELLHARSSFYTDRLVWIDAICINQDNKTEKGGQIPLMNQIYSKADQVIVWPGDQYDSGMASTMLKRIFIANYQFEAEDEEFRSLFEDETGRPGWKAMIKLFENPYFTRIWCLQEVALSKDTVIYHGNQYIPWQMFVETLATYIHPRRRTLLAGDPNGFFESALEKNSVEGPSGALVMHIIRDQRQSPKEGKNMHIGQLMAYCARFHATEDKDHIIGLSGLLSPQLPAMMFEPSTPDWHIYILASILALRQSTYPFATLAYAGIGWGPKPDYLPSWAINWSQSRHTFSLCGHNLAGPWTTGRSSESYPAWVKFYPSSTCLFIKGFILDTIATQTTAVTHSSEEDQKKTIRERSILRSQWYLDAANLATASPELYPYTKQTREEAFWRTIIADRVEDQIPAPQYLEHTHRLYREICKARLAAPSEKPESFHEHVVSTPEVEALWPKTLKERGYLHEFMTSIASAGDGRRFGVSQHGYMCLTPPESAVGDIIAIFHGAPTPFLLRRDVKRSGSDREIYELVGECYVHGFMDRFDSIADFVAPKSRIFSIS